MGREARANVVGIEPFHFYIPIAKVDKETRLVTGIATQEILDKQGDIVDYETAKAFFSDEALWPGNMREMHEPKAVGKKVSCEFDDDNKTITLTSRVSKGAPDTWEKVQDGTLSFYSIGGGGTRKAETTPEGKAAKRLFLKSLAEVSYVDNGACPTAKFEIVKTADGHLVDAEPAELEEPAADDPATIIAKAADAIAAAVASSATKATETPAPAVVVVEGTLMAGTIRKMIEVLAKSGGLARKADIVAQAQAAGPAFVLELPTAWQGDEAIAKAAAERVAKGGPETYDIDAALSAISFVNRLMANEYWETRYSLNPATPEQQAQVAMLRAAADALLQFLLSEYAEQFAPQEDGTSMGAVVADATAVEMFVKTLPIVQKAGARHSKNDNAMIQQVHDLSGNLGAACASDFVESDAAKVLTFVAREKVAEILKGAGYQAPATATLDPAIASTPAPGEVVAKAADDCKACKGTKKVDDKACPDCSKEAAVTPIAEAGTEQITKLEGELATTKAALETHQASVAKLAETNARLEERLTAIERLPAQGGPVRSEAGATVDKAIGSGAAAGDGDVNPTSLIKALEAIAKDSPDANVRQAAALQVIKVQQATGHNTIDLSAR